MPVAWKLLPVALASPRVALTFSLAANQPRLGKTKTLGIMHVASSGLNIDVVQNVLSKFSVWYGLLETAALYFHGNQN